LLHFLQKIGFVAPIPISLFCDNQDALHIALNLVYHERTKDIEVDYHLSECRHSTPFVKSENQLANIFTKSLYRNHSDFGVNLFQDGLIWQICSSLRGSFRLLEYFLLF
jgi:hypothetical protein